MVVVVFLSILPSMLRKMTMTSTFHHRFQHIIRQIACLLISFPSICNIIIFKAKWDRQIKVYVYFSKNIFRYIFLRQCWKWKYMKNTKSAVCCSFLDTNLKKHCEVGGGGVGGVGVVVVVGGGWGGGWGGWGGGGDGVGGGGSTRGLSGPRTNGAHHWGICRGAQKAIGNTVKSSPDVYWTITNLDPINLVPLLEVLTR